MQKRIIKAEVLTGAIINDICDSGEPLDPHLLDYIAAMPPIKHPPTAGVDNNPGKA